jgi:uncharacterized membrane protein YidH (DUF202 family)
MGVSDRWEHLRDGFAPWAGLAAATLGGGFAHQVGSESVFDECASSPELVLTVCIIGAAIAALGALESWTVFRSDSEAPARKLIATVSLGTAALVVFAVCLPIVASLVIPQCHA